ncbi:MAG TPA: protein kinase [Micromonosporaceae bacterium]|nr:protein kinase [Micromonosporaceae bacterium]
MKPLGTADPASVGPYRLLGVLGGGGMGRVYLGQSPTGRRVAIKVVHAVLADDPAFRRRFAREVDAMRAVSPLFTAAVVDADTDAPEPWLATTYIDGLSLEQRVDEEGPLPPGAVLTLAAGLAEALASIHHAGIVHRDLKPSNVLLDDTGPHIIDFGVALASDVTRMTRSVVVGTPSYMAPERINGGDAGPAGDVFSLGATLVFAATGRCLVNDGTVYEQIVQIAHGRFDLSLVPKDLRPLIVRCLSPKPKDRPTAPELARVLVGAGISAPSPGWHREGAPAPAALDVRLGGQHPSRRQMLTLGGILSVVAVGGLGAAGILGSENASPGSSQVGRVRWLARSGASFLDTRLGSQEIGVRIVVDRGARLISVSGVTVRAVDLQGGEVWSRELSSGPLALTLWGDGVLVTNVRRAWLLDGVTGVPRFDSDVAGAEEATAKRGPGSPTVGIRGVAVSADHAYLYLGTATVALDRAGRQWWRNPRPVPVGGGWDTSGNPVLADATWLVTRDQDGDVVQVGLYEAATGRRRWTARYDVPAPPTFPSRAGERPGGPRPGGDDAWQRCEVRVSTDHVVVRDVQTVRALALASGREAWMTVSSRPVAAMELVGSRVLVASERVTAFEVDTGEVVWRAELYGARLAALPAGDGVVAANDSMIVALDRNGDLPWQEPVPAAVRAEAMPGRLTADGQMAYLTLKPRGDRSEPLTVDVIAIALDV